MEFKYAIDRRGFMGSALAMGVGFTILGGDAFGKEEEHGEEVSALEDLMREHGALNRVLLIYEESQRRIRAKRDFQPKAVEDAATIIRNFIENYHEKLEEEFVFPRLEKAGKHADLARILRKQHEAGRALTSHIITLSKGSPKTGVLPKIDSAISSFIRMYRPHEAFEDTVVFPAFKRLLPKKEYEELGEKFEDREHELLGKQGFEGVLEQLDEIERTLGIQDISQFTPKGI